MESRGVHLPNARNVNTPVDGIYPFGDPTVRLLTESSGRSWQRQLVANANVQWRGVFLFGFYALSYGRDDNEGLPAAPYNLRAEWGPSTYGDVRHRGALGATLPLKWKWSVSPFLVANSGTPYNITTGLDPDLTGFPSARPALVVGAPAGCQKFGCFQLDPPPGTCHHRAQRRSWAGERERRAAGGAHLGIRTRGRAAAWWRAAAHTMVRRWGCLRVARHGDIS